ncbi:MAG: T9SS type A sorting domain-containing protein [Saprospiraceae bacterium]|nr:T9SS type A sorting domain-containing protein [Saprospiraceae bacterium]
MDQVGLRSVIVLGGRQPVNPTNINCERIEYFNPDNEWVGFRLTKNIEGQQNIESLFEIEYLVSGPGGAYKTVYFKRLVEPNILVAANLLDNYPTTNAPEIQTDYLFNIGERDQNGAFSGFASVYLVLNDDFTFDLCSDLDPNGGSLYSYETLVADKVLPPSCQGCPPNTTYSRPQTPNLNPIVIQNPVSEFVNVFFPKNFQHGLCQFFIYNFQGSQISFEEINVPEFQATISIDKLPSGIYTLIVVAQDSVQSLKFIKQ